MFISKSKKSPFYQITYEVNGKRTTISSGTKNLAEAKKFMSNLYVENDPKPKSRGKSISISKFSNEYLDYIKNTKSNNYIRSVALSFKMLIEHIGDVKLKDVDFRTIDKFITFTFIRTNHGASLYYRTLKAAFSKAVQWNYMEENYLKKIKSPKPPKTYPHFITEEELNLIIANTTDLFLKDMFCTAFYTGMRLGELINMKWTWINFDKRYLTVKCADGFVSKSKKERIIPVTTKINSILVNRHSYSSNPETGFVFTKIQDIKLHEDYVSKRFKKAVKLAGLRNEIHFHSLRHSFASLLVQKGISLYVVKELLGHDDITTTMIYSHLQPQNLRDAIKALEE